MELTLDRVTKNYGSKIACDRISITFTKGVYGLLGANGAGKTTLMRMLCGVLNPTSGSISYDGIDVSREEYRDVLGYLPQDFGYYPEFTAQDFMMYMAALKGLTKAKAKAKTAELLELVSLTNEAKKKIKTFSGGMKQRLGIAQAMLNDPKILVLDEPTAGLDPKERVRFRNLISRMGADRIILLSTHIVSDIESIANQVIMIKDKHLYQMDTVANICGLLDGKVYERPVADDDFTDFEKEHLVLSARQEQEFLQVRYYSEKPEAEAKPCTPNLEDMFLVSYQ